MINQEEKRELFKSWQDGTISSGDRRRLEVEALEDDFLFEAMEGFATNPSEDSSRLAALEQKLSERVRPSKTRRIWLVPAAAATIISIVAAVFLLRNDVEDVASTKRTELYSEVLAEEFDKDNAEKKQEWPAENEAAENFSDITDGVQEPEPKKVQIDQTFSNEANDLPPELAVLKEDSPVSAVEEVEVMLDDEMSEDGMNVTSSQALPEALESDVIEEDEVAMEADSYSSQATPRESAAAPMASKKRAKSSVAENRNEGINGILLDDNSSPLIGAQVQYGDEFATTDFDGAFQFEAPFKKGETIKVSYIGYDEKSYTLTSDEKITIQMDPPSSMLSEVVVSSAAGGVKSQPVMGYEAFEKYIESDKQRTKAADENNLRGIVRLRFNVNKSGKPVRIKVISGLGYGLDEEAIRLLESSKWTPGKQNEIEIEL